MHSPSLSDRGLAGQQKEAPRTRWLDRGAGSELGLGGELSALVSNTPWLRIKARIPRRRLGRLRQRHLDACYGRGSQTAEPAGVGKGPRAYALGTGQSAPRRIEARGATSRIVLFPQRNANSTKLRSRSQKKPRARGDGHGADWRAHPGRENRARPINKRDQRSIVPASNTRSPPNSPSAKAPRGNCIYRAGPNKRPSWGAGIGARLSLNGAPVCLFRGSRWLLPKRSLGVSHG